MEPTPYRVSTITCNATVSTKVDLDLFFQHVAGQTSGFVWAEHGTKNKGERPKKKRASSSDGKKGFDNQVTTIYKLGDGYYPNVKIFRNGGLQMTGIRSPADGQRMSDIMADEVLRIHKQGHPIVEDPSHVAAKDFKIRMINCDFGFPLKIKRKSLHNIIINKYGTTCTFQPLTYPGVKLQYAWNGSKAIQDGICSCSNNCFGKGCGQGDGECKRVTIAVFDSGKILITGANSFEQVNDAYSFICRVIKTHVSEVQKVLPVIRA